MRESRPDRFRRVAEARVNKIIKMVRLLGNCSNPAVYAFTQEQVQQIFATLRDELDRAQKRYTRSYKNFPAINVYWDTEKPEIDGPICFAEYNPERGPCHEVCIGAYQSDKEDTVYYKPYMAERESNE